MSRGTAQPIVLIACITITHLQSPGCIAFSCLYRSKPITISWDNILPIIKPVLLKLYVSLSGMLYTCLVYWTRSNQGLITAGSLYRALYRSYGWLNRVIRLGVRLIKLNGHFYPTWPAPRLVYNLLAISYIALSVGINPRESRSRICCLITSSSSLVSFFKLAS